MSDRGYLIVIVAGVLVAAPALIAADAFDAPGLAVAGAVTALGALAAREAWLGPTWWTALFVILAAAGVGYAVSRAFA